MVKKRSEGLEALVAKQEPISIQEITMQDRYAAFSMLNWPPMTNNKDAAKECWDRAEAMMEERNRRM